jgi:hypothetical protein
LSIRIEHWQIIDSESPGRRRGGARCRDGKRNYQIYAARVEQACMLRSPWKDDLNSIRASVIPARPGMTVLREL